MVRCPPFTLSFLLTCFPGIVHGEITLDTSLHRQKLMAMPSVRLVDCQRYLVVPRINVFLRGLIRPVCPSACRERLRMQVNVESQESERFETLTLPEDRYPRLSLRINKKYSVPCTNYNGFRYHDS